MTPWERVFGKKWVLTENLGLAGLRILSSHRTRADAILSIPVADGNFRVMRREMAAWHNSDASWRLIEQFGEDGT